MNVENEKYLIVRKELVAKILEKLDKISKMSQSIPAGVEERSEDIQRLVSVDDELDDVLLNWSDRMRSLHGFGEFDEFDDD